MNEMNISIRKLQSIVSAALVRSNTHTKIAKIVAKHLIDSEIDGKKGHGISRIKSYCLHSRCGKVDGNAFPKIIKSRKNILTIDACNGFAYPAFELLIPKLSEIAKVNGISMGSIINSHHFGVAGHHVEKAAEFGKISLLFGNTPSAIIPFGGKKAIFGTNPLAFSAPSNDGKHIIIDMAMSKVARGKILKAAENNEIIPNDWGLNKSGNKTSDPKSVLNGGGLLPMGDAKGYALAMMVEIMTSILTGGNFSYNASSMFDDQGGNPKLGQLMIMIDPSSFLNLKTYYLRINELIKEINKQPNVRIPGSNRFKFREEAKKNGIGLDSKIVKEIEKL